MDDSTLQTIPYTGIPSYEIVCPEHKHIGEFPCPWPGCKNGIEQESFIGKSVDREPQTTFVRRKWGSIHGEERYSWDDMSLFASFQTHEIIRQENFRLFRLQPELPEQIFHYTTIEGLFGILQTGQLWLTDYQYMNDSKEILHGLELARETLKELRESLLYPEKEALLNALQDSLYEGPSGRVCIACFSLDRGDSLSQWRAYSKNGAGIAIGFRTKGTQFWSGRGARLSRVVYDEEEQKQRLATIFHIYLVMHDWDMDKKILDVNGKELRLDPSQFSLTSISSLYESLVYFKNNAFSDEREARWVYREERAFLIVFKMKLPNKRFRIAKNKIIPYMTSEDLDEVAFSDQRKKNIDLPISEIVIGPQENQDIVKMGVLELLDSYGYKSIPVRRSRVPFRP